MSCDRHTQGNQAAAGGHQRGTAEETCRGVAGDVPQGHGAPHQEVEVRADDLPRPGSGLGRRCCTAVSRGPSSLGLSGASGGMSAENGAAEAVPPTRKLRISSQLGMARQLGMGTYNLLGTWSVRHRIAEGRAGWAPACPALPLVGEAAHEAVHSGGGRQAVVAAALHEQHRSQRHSEGQPHELRLQHNA